jgi:hypothetical protein
MAASYARLPAAGVDDDDDEEGGADSSSTYGILKEFCPSVVEQLDDNEEGALVSEARSKKGPRPSSGEEETKVTPAASSSRQRGAAESSVEMRSMRGASNASEDGAAVESLDPHDEWMYCRRHPDEWVRRPRTLFCLRCGTEARHCPACARTLRGDDDDDDGGRQMRAAAAATAFSSSFEVGDDDDDDDDEYGDAADTGDGAAAAEDDGPADLGAGDDAVGMAAADVALEDDEAADEGDAQQPGS